MADRRVGNVRAGAVLAYDVTATLRAAVAKITAAPEPPAFVLHTGDLTHLSKPAEFDTLQKVLSELTRRFTRAPRR